MERKEFVIKLQEKGLIVVKRKKLPWNTVIGIHSRIPKTDKTGIIELYEISSEILDENYDYLLVYKLLCEKYKL